MGGGQGEEQEGVTNSFTKSSSGVCDDLLQGEPQKKVWPRSSADPRRHRERHGRPGATDQQPKPERNPGSAAQHPARSTAGESAESWQRQTILGLLQHSASRWGTGGAAGGAAAGAVHLVLWREKRGSLVVEHQVGTAAPLRLTDCQVTEAPLPSGKETAK